MIASSEPEQALLLHAAAAAARLAVPLIALASGPAERMSRILNPIFTPATHPLLSEAEGAAARWADIATVDGLLAARRALGYLPSKRFFIFGKPTVHSPSPAIHNAGFAANGYCHTYGVAETDDPEEALRILRTSGTGGGSVTIPLKETLLPHMQILSQSARRWGRLGLSSQGTGELGARGRVPGGQWVWNVVVRGVSVCSTCWEIVAASGADDSGALHRTAMHGSFAEGSANVGPAIVGAYNGRHGTLW